MRRNGTTEPEKRLARFVSLGLYNVVRSMKTFAAMPNGDADFWQPAPLLARLAAEAKTFN